MTSYRTLEHVAIDATPFPVDVLEGASSGLILFAAAFLGVNDAIHFALAGVRDVTLIDVDGARLDEMVGLYRDPSWYFLERDAWEFASDAHEKGLAWDVVVVDTFLGDATDRSLADLEHWTRIANRAVVATTVGLYADVPRGWYGRLRRRTAGADWLVLRPGDE